MTDDSNLDTPPRERNAFLFHGVVCFLSVLSTAIYLLPCLNSVSTKVPCTYPDVYMFIWNIWAAQKQTGVLPDYLTDAIFLPAGASLLLHTWCEGLVWLLARVFPQTNPIVLFNLTCCIAFVLNVLSAAFLAHTLGIRRFPLIVLALTLGFHPFVVSHLQGGHLNFVFVAPLFVVLALWFRPESAQQSLKISIAIAAALSWTVFYNLYFTYYLAMLSLVLFGVEVLLNRRNVSRIVTFFIVPWAVTGIVTSPHLLAVLRMSMSGTYTPNHDPSKHSADLVNFLVPSAYQFFGNFEVLETVRKLSSVNSAEQGVYIGWTFLLMACWGIWAGKKSDRDLQVKAGLSFLCFFLLAFGSVAKAAGMSLIPLPWFDLVAHNLPAFPSVPVRFGFLASLMVVVLAIRSTNSMTPIAKVCFSIAAFLEMLPGPVGTLELRPTEVMQYMSEDSSYTVLDLDEINEITLIRQVFHGKPIVGGYLARRPRAYERFLRRNKFLRFVRSGENFAPEVLRKAFDELAAQRVLVRAEDLAKLDRVRSVPWLSHDQSDQNVALFKVIAG